MLPISTILHVTDFSEPAAKAFQVACSLARSCQARLIVLHVVPPVLTAYPPLPTEWSRREMEELNRIQAPDPQIRLEHRLENGDPIKEILRVAEEIGCDLIVMGTHGRSGIGRLVLGSVAENVVRHAHCPVVTVQGS